MHVGRRGDTPSAKLWMPWFVRDHRAESMTLNHVEHSAMTYLKCLLWEREGTLPDDDSMIARELRLTVIQWRKMRPLLLHDCTVAGGVITHPWTVGEYARALANIEQKRAAGVASAAARALREANERATGVGTDVQPRAGRGEGEGPSHDTTVLCLERARSAREA